ncbi:hypothetical protein STEG23_026160, partial [Scotinomys teguina]
MLYGQRPRFLDSLSAFLHSKQLSASKHLIAKNFLSEDPLFYHTPNPGFFDDKLHKDGRQASSKQQIETHADNKASRGTASGTKRQPKGTGPGRTMLRGKSRLNVGWLGYSPGLLLEEDQLVAARTPRNPRRYFRCDRPSTVTLQAAPEPRQLLSACRYPRGHAMERLDKAALNALQPPEF